MVIFFEMGRKLLDETCSGGVDYIAVTAELVVPQGNHPFVPLAVFPHLFQQTVALFEGFIVLYEVVEVNIVGLRNDTVDKLATQVAATGYQLAVGGRHHDQRHLANVFRKSLVCLLVPTHLLTLAST